MSNPSSKAKRIRTLRGKAKHKPRERRSKVKFTDRRKAWAGGDAPWS